MAMTAQVKAELASTQITKTCCRKAEVASMLRFAGGLHIVSGRIVVEAEFDTGAAARRLRTNIAEVYGHQSDVVMVQGNGIRKGSRYIVRVVKDGEALARQTGLLDQRGRPVRGLPPAVVSGGGCDAVAAWRGAFLAHGSLTEPGRSSALEVTCPGPEAALALVGVARRLGIHAKAREVRGRPGGGARRRRHRGAAGPAGAPTEVADGLGGAADASRGAGHRQPAGRFGRRQPAAFGPGRGRGRGPGGAGPGHPRTRRPRPPPDGRRPADHPQAGLLGGARSVARPAADQGRDHRRPDPPAAGDGRQARPRVGHPRHRGLADPRRCSTTPERPPGQP